jgi:transcriptional regulator with XRE-family HTH domain
MTTLISNQEVTNVSDQSFADRLADLRKAKGYVQQTLAEKVGLHVGQIRRYETGRAQPTLDVIKKLAIALEVSADQLVFGTDERGPDDDLRLEFEAVSHFGDEDKKLVKSVLKGLILKHESEKWGNRK